MKRKFKIFFVILIIILLSISFTCIVSTLKADKNNHQEVLAKVDKNNEIENLSNTDEKIQQDLINVSECSEDFMENYFEENKKLNEENNKENVLIVTSKSEIKDSFGASNIIEAPNNQYILQYDSEEEKQQAFKELNKLDSTVTVEENILRTVAEYNSWGIEKINLDYATEIANTKKLNDVTVAIIDTGCDMELFNKNYPGKIIETYNVLNPGGEMVDTDGHGTHIAGTIAEGTPDNVKILPIKASVDGRFYTTDLIAAINYVVYYDKADVINMSYGGYGYTDSEYQAIENAKQENIICVAAAGNDNVSTKFYPAAFDSTLSIASVDSELNKSYFSNYGSTISFAAPGSNILSINGAKSGTSMAAPHAVCAVAILKSYNNDITLEDTIELLKVHTLDLGDVGWDKYYGHGVISFENAQFCDGENCTKGDCDEFGIFKIEPEEVVNIEKIEIPMPIITSKNYGTIYNLLSMEMKISYSDGTYETKALWEIDDLEIKGYDPYSTEEQIVEVKYGELSTTFSIQHPENYELGWEYNILDENSIELTLYKDNRNDIGKLYVPETIDGYNVVSLAGAPDSSSVAQIFYNSYDAYAFEEIILPKTLTKIGKAVFMGSGIRKVTSLADSVAIGPYAFYEAGKIEIFDGKISELGQSSFSGCSKLDHVTLIDTMEVIPTNAFTLCYELEHINFPSSLTTIELNAFLYTKLENVVLPEGVTKIGNYAFASCLDLESITLPESLIEIGNGAFTYTNIKKLVIPQNVSSIGKGILDNCSSLISIEVDKGNLVYDSRDNCNAIIETDTNILMYGCMTTQIPSTIKIIGDGAFYGNLALSMIIIPDGVTQIEANAFYGCYYLKQVIIPRSVTTIGENAFEYFSTLWLYTDSYAKTYATQNEIPYEALDISYIRVELERNEYKAFEFIDKNDISIKLYYDRATTVNDTYTEYTGIRGREEIIDTEYAYSTPITPPGYILAYGPKDEYGHYETTFRYGDTYFTIIGIDERGEEFEKQVDITVVKDTPYYTIPEGLKAEAGTKLSEITLPEGFEWMDDTQVVTGDGDEVYYVRFVPKDTNNYEIIENIEVIVNETSNVMTDFAMCGLKTEYRAFETLDIDNLYAMITYDDGHIEYVYDDITIRYEQKGQDCFQYGDTLFHVEVVNKKGMLIIRSVYVTVLKAIPEYTVPTNIEATIGQTLSEISLPEGFEWIDSTQVLTEIGNTIYKVKYTPIDTENYEIVDNIEINVNVLPIKCTSIYSPQESFTIETDTAISDLGIYALPEDATNQELSYELEDTSIARIENNTIIVVKDGTTNLIVKTTDGSNITKNIIIVVDKPLPFLDISKTDWCYNAVKFVYNNGYILGFNSTRYGPGEKLTRGMIVTILSRIENGTPTNSECNYIDVAEGEFYTEPVKWATEVGIVQGYVDGTFRPNKAITREELAIVLRNYTRYKGGEVELTADLSGFNDGDTVSDFAQEAIEWAVARGVITGYAHDNTLKPQGTCTRDVAAEMIYKYFKNVK